MASEQEKRLHRCCFTGYRPEKLEQSEDEIREWLTEQIENAICGLLVFLLWAYLRRGIRHTRWMNSMGTRYIISESRITP